MQQPWLSLGAPRPCTHPVYPNLVLRPGAHGGREYQVKVLEREVAMGGVCEHEPLVCAGYQLARTRNAQPGRPRQSLTHRYDTSKNHAVAQRDAVAGGNDAGQQGQAKAGNSDSRREVDAACAWQTGQERGGSARHFRRGPNHAAPGAPGGIGEVKATSSSKGLWPSGLC